MARTLNNLSALAVKNAAAGKYADGGGLWLVKREDGGGQWVLRLTVHGRRREMGLGSILEVSLKEAREEAERWRAVARSGLDPISPDFNPIENAFSKLKAMLRARAERKIDALWDAVGTLIPRFTSEECANYFRAAGYDPD